jgi:hypothetical protein
MHYNRGTPHCACRCVMIHAPFSSVFFGKHHVVMSDLWRANRLRFGRMQKFVAVSLPPFPVVCMIVGVKQIAESLRSGFQDQFGLHSGRSPLHTKLSSDSVLQVGCDASACIVVARFSSAATLPSMPTFAQWKDCVFAPIMSFNSRSSKLVICTHTAHTP